MKLGEAQQLIEATLIALGVGLTVYVLYRFLQPIGVKAARREHVIAKHNVSVLNLYSKELVASQRRLVSAIDRYTHSEEKFQALLEDLQRCSAQLAEKNIESGFDRALLEGQLKDALLSAIKENPRLKPEEVRLLRSEVRRIC